MDSRIGATHTPPVSCVTLRTMERLDPEVQAFTRQLVQINNARGMDGIRGREGERAGRFEGYAREAPRELSQTELGRQVSYRDITRRRVGTLSDLAAAAYVGPINTPLNMAQALRRISSIAVAPGLRPALERSAASALNDVTVEDHYTLAYAIAHERAANGTHLFILDIDHGPFCRHAMTALSVSIAQGVVGDLAAGEAHVGALMCQFGLMGPDAREVLQMRAVNGVAGDAVAAGVLSYDDARLKYGFCRGFPSTSELARQSEAARARRPDLASAVPAQENIDNVRTLRNGSPPATRRNDAPESHGHH